MNYNPYINNPYGNNYFPYSKTPQQLREEIDNSMKEYTNLYNQNQQFYPQPQMSPDVFNWKYTDNGEEEIKTLQVPVNGNPFILIGNGIFWVKKFKNGQTYVNAYSFSALNNTGEPSVQNSTVENKEKDDISSQLNKMMEMIGDLHSRLNKIEGDNQ